MAPYGYLQEVNPGLTPSGVAQHYGITVAANNGAGQSVAIISLGGPLDKSERLADLEAMGVNVQPAIHGRACQPAPGIQRQRAHRVPHF